MLKYKAESAGIEVIITEESFTSKASFLDRDHIPVYGKDENFSFSGKRISKGLYRSKDNMIINAVVNAAYNIMKKAVSEAEKELLDRSVGLSGIMSTPLVLKVS